MTWNRAGLVLSGAGAVTSSRSCAVTPAPAGEVCGRRFQTVPVFEKCMLILYYHKKEEFKIKDEHYPCALRQHLVPFHAVSSACATTC